MSLARTSLLFVSTLAVVATLAHGAGAPDPIIGTWQGIAVAVDVTTVDGVTDDQIASGDDSELSCNAGHGAVWLTNLGGTWKKKGGLHSVALSNGFAAYLQATIPAATVKKAKYNLNAIDVAETSLFGESHAKELLTVMGVKSKVIETGAFALALQ